MIRFKHSYGRLAPPGGHYCTLQFVLAENWASKGPTGSDGPMRSKSPLNVFMLLPRSEVDFWSCPEGNDLLTLMLQNR